MSKQRIAPEFGVQATYRRMRFLGTAEVHKNRIQLTIASPHSSVSGEVRRSLLDRILLKNCFIYRGEPTPQAYQLAVNKFKKLARQEYERRESERVTNLENINTLNISECAEHRD